MTPLQLITLVLVMIGIVWWLYVPYILMTGPPGAGKTLISKSLPSIMPRMTVDESLEVTKIYSVAGLLPSDTPLIKQRPFRSPHHTISYAGLVGGGAWPRPGKYR